MPFVKIRIHLIFGTKYRERIITNELKSQLLPHIRENAIKKNIHIDSINCVEDHIHFQISMGSTQCISNVAQLIKGESSCWINKNKLLRRRFEWQDDYIALSVSDSHASMVREYIKNQEVHHRKKSFEEEYSEFIKKFGLKPESPG